MNEQKRFLNKGRPLKSPIRDNIELLLSHLGKMEGYLLYKVYLEVFGEVNIRSIYYHLKKGCEIGLFEIKEIKEEKGEHSWGNYSRKVWYGLAKKNSREISTELAKRIDDALKIVEKQD